ncbi:MAG: trypsin-like serine protease [Candidatus Marinimicrobia bacterium]|jgi:serine protease Do|nr:trypsin-like serine protease [Candidatus Neomarinimicrobiota bacterium]MBT3683874.1 trypsin-like serine protease [Candidatus Neomarinimicrobiota bacterium]MBT3760599.1 trypsin-like serine protease [Candidatus Neomarinimicrobiota bacterium]MBT3897008.1 trypsin-like serine protease [Candidatus Neomarinimicrobiota bacterium]MBT4174024.1 trypsin-like serine protease [Candidatus Neomarinimicrobiota bacterium]
MTKLFIKTIIIIWAVFIAFKYFTNLNADSTDDPTSLSTEFSDITSSRKTAITRAIEKVSPSVVGINVTQLKRKRGNLQLDPFWGLYYPKDKVYQVESLGSGAIISEDGYVVSNAHVVEDAHEILVTLPGGIRLNAELVGSDKLTDIALLKVDESNLPFTELGNSDDLIVGEWAIALGNPLGLFDVGYEPTATLGIISGLDMDFGLKESGRVYQDMIQTDASINPGNSGGPLVNSLGQIIGINTFILTGGGYSTGSIGIGFSIPINRVKEIIEELKKHGKVERDFSTGVHVQAIDSYLKQYLRLPSTDGVIITDIEKLSAGDKAGLLIGDIILEVEDQNIKSHTDILRVIDEGFKKVGDFVTLTIWRDGNVIELPLELADRK